MTDRKQQLRRALEDGRRQTIALLNPLDDDEVHRQIDPLMSPLVWDLGHIGNYEELWLLRALDHREASSAALDRLYNPFENPRWVRADLPILARAEATEYVADIRAEALRLLRGVELAPDVPLLADGFVYALVVQHEAQHQETMLQALDLRDAASTPPGGSPSGRAPRPYAPAAHRVALRARPVDPAERVVVPGGPFVLGTDDRAQAYDNERPAHQVDVPTFLIDRFPVTAGRYAAFLNAGGYDREELWSERGRAWLAERGHRAPQGWIPDGQGGWVVRRFGHTFPLDPCEPVQHVCWFEAEAFARWAGGRLPSEAEWEKAARWDPAAQRARTYPWGESPPTPAVANLDRRAWGPVPVGAYPAGASAYGVEQLVGDVYEWTSSAFEAYPGYRTFPYPEYSEVFFGGDYRVLRGGSWASRPSYARASFRNWDHPQRRQIFAGIRLAWDR